jgi:hypothetical protein
MPEQVVITKELILSHPHHNSGIFSSPTHAIRCSLCMPPKPKHMKTKEYIHRVKHHVLRIGSQAVKVTFRNGTVAYYGLACWNNPENADRVKRILMQEHKPKIELTQLIS